MTAQASCDGLPAAARYGLQSFLNTARTVVIFKYESYCVTSRMEILHWLLISIRIKGKAQEITFQAPSSAGPHLLLESAGKFLPQRPCAGCSLCLQNSFAVTWMARSRIRLGFLLKCQCGLSLAPQSKIADLPHSIPVLLPPLWFVPCEPCYHLLFHIFCFSCSFPPFFHWDVKARISFASFTALSSTHRRVVSSSLYTLG